MDERMECGLVTLRVECSSCGGSGSRGDPLAREFFAWIDGLLAAGVVYAAAGRLAYWAAFLAAKGVPWYELGEGVFERCEDCRGTGRQEELVTLAQLKHLLDRPIPF